MSATRPLDVALIGESLGIDHDATLKWVADLVERGRARVLDVDEHGDPRTVEFKTRGRPWPTPGENEAPAGTRWRALAERDSRGRVDPSWTGRWRSTRGQAVEQARRWIANAENTGIEAVDIERSDGTRERLWMSDFSEFCEASERTRATGPRTSAAVVDRCVPDQTFLPTPKE